MSRRPGQPVSEPEWFRPAPAVTEPAPPVAEPLNLSPMLDDCRRATGPPLREYSEMLLSRRPRAAANHVRWSPLRRTQLRVVSDARPTPQAADERHKVVAEAHRVVAAGSVPNAGVDEDVGMGIALARWSCIAWETTASASPQTRSVGVSRAATRSRRRARGARRTSASIRVPGPRGSPPRAGRSNRAPRSPTTY